MSPTKVSEEPVPELCTCPAQMLPHDKVKGVCPIPRVGVEWRERKGLWRDPTGGRHSTRVREGVE